MNSSVELHDSRVAEIARSGSDLHIVFRPAYVHRADGVAGSDPGRGYLQPVEFVFRGATCSEIGECRGPVLDGEVSANGVQYLNLVPLSAAIAGDITARLEFSSGGALTVSASSFSCEPIGEVDPSFRERYDG